MWMEKTQQILSIQLDDLQIEKGYPNLTNSYRLAKVIFVIPEFFCEHPVYDTVSCHLPVFCRFYFLNTRYIIQFIVIS